jgi:hypothetical protein
MRGNGYAVSVPVRGKDEDVPCPIDKSAPFSHDVRRDGHAMSIK